MNDYARVRSKNEKKKQEKIVSLLSHWKLPSFLVRRFAFFLRLFPFFFVFGFFSLFTLTFDGRLTSWGRKQETETRRSKRTTKEKKKKKEKREKNRSAFDSLGSFQTTRGIKEGDARIEGASTRAETKKKRQRRGREKECPV